MRRIPRRRNSRDRHERNHARHPGIPLTRHNTVIPIAGLLRIVLLALLLCIPVGGRAEEFVFDLARAENIGGLAMGGATASATVAPGDGARVLFIEFDLGEKGIGGAWAKGFPAAFGPGAVDLIEVTSHMQRGDGPIALAMEFKGDKGTQGIDLQVLGRERLQRTLIDWKAVGTPQEVVILVRPAVPGASPVGTAHVGVRFRAMTVAEYVAATPPRRFAGALLFATAMLLITGLARSIRRKSDATVAAAAGPRGLLADAALAASFLSALSAVALTFSLGDAHQLDYPLVWLIVPALSLTAAALSKIAVARLPITGPEAFRAALIPGLFAASASTRAILQSPQQWMDVVLLSGFGAASFCLVQQIVSYASVLRGKGLPGSRAALIVAATPYTLGLLTAIGSPLASSISQSLATSHPWLVSVAGAAVIMLLFNELLAQGVSIATRRCLLTAPGAHAVLVICAFLVAAAPRFADHGSGAFAAGLPLLVRPFLAVLATVLSQGALWGEVFMATGMLLAAIRGEIPAPISLYRQAMEGARKGMMYGGVLMAILQLHGLALIGTAQLPQSAAVHTLVAILAGVICFPLGKTIVETFDGSTAFLRRAAASYRRPLLYARGLVVGVAVAIAAGADVTGWPTLPRTLFGVAAGVLAYAGVNIARDLFLASRGLGGKRGWRATASEALLGAFVGGGFGFYLDAMQVPVVADKLRLYATFGLEPRPDDFNALLSKWGHLTLPSYQGGAKLLFNESLKGVIGWGVAAWLFAANNAFLTALFNRDTTPIRRLATRDGLIDLGNNTVGVLRWGLWMAPVIFTFLRQMSDPTWYNQDGAIRTVVATVNSVRLPGAEFASWSRETFLWVLAYDPFRILIWLDHMGLRVATLVNLSFIGMDRLDGRLARFVGRASGARFIHDGVKRFATWAPLLIPFYIPAGENWAYVWNNAELTHARASSFSALDQWTSIPHSRIALGVFMTLAVLTIVISFIRSRRSSKTAPMRIARGDYEVILKPSGELLGTRISNGHDLARRSYEGIDPSGRLLFVTLGEGAPPRVLIGNAPGEFRLPTHAIEVPGCLALDAQDSDVTAVVGITLDEDDGTTYELWSIALLNAGESPRRVRLCPYIEWLLNGAGADRNHTQYNRLFVEVRYDAALNAIIAQHRGTGTFGYLAALKPPSGILTGRVDFIGRAGSIWSPNALLGGTFAAPVDRPATPPFDPIGALLFEAQLAPGESYTLSLLMGLATSVEQATRLLKGYQDPTATSQQEPSEKFPPPIIGHGAAPTGTPTPYAEYVEEGSVLRVYTPFTPRPFDHTLANRLGHVVSVTNRGLHTSASVNAQQNRLTTDWADTVGAQLPAEMILLHDLESHEWFAPTFHPLNDREASHEVDFGLDGTALFRMRKGALSTELTVFVPPDDPVGVYRLTIRNHGSTPRRLRVGACYTMVLGDYPERSGRLRIARDAATNTLLFANPRNGFRRGTAFAACSLPGAVTTTARGAFIGNGRASARPAMVETGSPADAGDDHQAAAAFVGEITVAAGGEVVVTLLLGQAGNDAEALRVARKYADDAAVRAELDATRRWWSDFGGTLKVRTDDHAFDAYSRWLRYQAYAERMLARRGFYQASGAFGFRDQLQDSVNLLWADPTLARRQILLHAAHQFIEGDVAHWFFLLEDGRTGLSNRSHASDNLLWLAWATLEYIRQTGDAGILDESVTYIEAEFPLEPLPQGKHGMVFFPHRSARSEPLLRHVLRAVDLVLGKRIGAHGLPLIGTGDWNDGLDEIGSQGRGESVWLAFFLLYILRGLIPVLKQRGQSFEAYRQAMPDLERAIDGTWREDRYLRAIHDDGTEIGVQGSGIWEVDALTASWAVIAGVEHARARTAFDTAIRELEREKVILLGTPALRADSRPYLGRSSQYPEGVRENGMYAHGVQWLVQAARILSERCGAEKDPAGAAKYRDTAHRLWRKISAIGHTDPAEIEIYGGQPNKQAADLLTTFEPGRMIWNGYTGAAGWMFRQAIEGVMGYRLEDGRVIPPSDLAEPRGGLKVIGLERRIPAKS